jgi:hypothetical protein
MLPYLKRHYLFVYADPSLRFREVPAFTNQRTNVHRLHQIRILCAERHGGHDQLDP